MLYAKKSCIEEAILMTWFFTPLCKITLGIVLHTLLVAAFSIICHVKLSDICLGQTFSSMWIYIEQKCLGQTFVWDRHMSLREKFSFKTFLFLHLFGCKQFYLVLHDPRFPKMCLVSKSDHGKWVKKLYKQTNKHTNIQNYVNFNIDE